MADFKPGDRCRIVEYDPETRQPKEGGRVLPATVTGVNGDFVAATTESTGSIAVLGPLYFDVKSGWLSSASASLTHWRLEPGTEADG